MISIAGQAPGIPGEANGAPRQARFSVEEFHRLCERLPQRRLELIDGEVVEVIAKGTRLTAVVHRLARSLTPLLESERAETQTLSRFELRLQAPLDLGESQEPAPDLAVVTARAAADEGGGEVSLSGAAGHPQGLPQPAARSPARLPPSSSG